MQESLEQDTCRICSAPAEVGQPLFHPCKCSGTIRYIHQDCLTTWLSHSKKKVCDVCKHPYSFTKVYASDMPARLPPVLLLRRLAQQSFRAILRVLRAIVVTVVWLGVLPWVTIWTCRMYFAMGDSTAWWISDLSRPNSSSPPNLFSFNLTLNPNVAPASSWASTSDTPFFKRFASYSYLNSLSSDIFTGQIIATLIVASFVTVFLLKEWINQNARPGMWGDLVGEGELPAAGDNGGQLPQFVQPAPELAPAPPVQQPPGHAQLGGQPLQVAPAPPAQQSSGTEQLGILTNEHASQESLPSPSPPPDCIDNQGTREAGAGPVAGPSRKMRRRTRVNGKGKHRETLLGDNVGRSTSQKQPRLYRRRIPLPEDISPSPVTKSLATDSDDSLDHTFRHLLNLQTPGFSSNARSEAPSIRNRPDDINPWGSGDITFAFGAPPSGSGVSQGDGGPDPLYNSASASQTHPHTFEGSYGKRPQLPTSASPTPTGDPSSYMPSASPPLATYHAPEEFGASFYDADADLESDVLDDDQFRDSDGDSDKDRCDLSHEITGVELLEGTSNFSDLGDDNPREVAVLFESGDDTEDEHPEEEDDDEAYDDDDARPHLREQLRGAVQVDVGPPPQQQGLQAAAVPDRAPFFQPEVGPIPLQVIDDMAEDDMDGAMEAIGMRGPVYGIAQNAALMIFVLDTAIGLGVWVPFTIGKSTALLSLDPHRFLQILHLPIKAMRIVTDPVVDTVVLLITSFVLPQAWKSIQTMVSTSCRCILYVTGTIFGPEVRMEVLEYLAWAVQQAEVSWRSLHSMLQFPDRSPKDSEPYLIEQTLHAAVQYAKPYMAILDDRARLHMNQLFKNWARLALGHGPLERAFAVALGYSILGLLLALYLNGLTIGNVKSAGKAVRRAIRQQLLIAKVTAFILIELVVFPFKCGVVIDLCTLCLFPQATFASRALFFTQAPLTAIFYHWVAGTMFMYCFAILLAGCRSILRPGAIWFIKDPQDQNSHPIRDILDRPTSTQLRKIILSAVMYSFVVVCVIATVAGLTKLGGKLILPLHWKTREPLSDVPIDLVLLHLALPHTMHYLRPVKSIKRIAEFIWKSLAARLRLTSYMFGGRHIPEEKSGPIWPLSLAVGLIVDHTDGVNDGTFGRVPANDHVVLPGELRVTPRVNADGEPIDEESRAIIEAQNREAETAKRVAKDDYTVVFIPPRLKLRLFILITSLWLIGALCLGLMVSAPLLLGRAAFNLTLDGEVHDGYSLILGFYLIWACHIFGRAIDRMDKRRQRKGGEGPRANLLVYAFKRGLLWAIKTAYMVISLGVVIPILVSIVVELYILSPFRFMVKPEAALRIRIADMWCLGILYVKILLRVSQMHPPNRFTPGLRRIMNNGWTHPDPAAATKELIAPLAGGLLAMIILPGVIYHSVQRFIFPFPMDDRSLFIHGYPGIFVLAGVLRVSTILLRVLSSWSQSIRDKEFLVEMRLANHEPERSHVRSDSSEHQLMTEDDAE